MAADCRHWAAALAAAGSMATAQAAPAHWAHDTQADPTTGLPSCVVRTAEHRPGWPVLTLMPGLVFAWPDGERAMGSVVSIRVDDQPAHTGPEWITGRAAAALVRELEHGQRARTQFVDRATDAPVDAVADLDGIADAIGACVDAMASSDATN